MVDLRSRSGDRGKRLSDAAAGGRPASDAAWVIDRSKKAHTVAAGFHMPVVSGKAAAAYGDGELHPRASAPPSAAPVNRPAAAPSPDASGKTEIDAVIHSGNSVPIPLNPSPATVKGGDRKSAADASTGAEPVVAGTTGRSSVPSIVARDTISGAVASDVALMNDLERELLNSLQTLFSSASFAPAPRPAALTRLPKPAAPALKPAAVDPEPKPRPTPPAAAAPDAPRVATAPNLHAEKPADRPERPAIAVARRSDKPAAAVSPSPERQAPSVSPPDQPPAAGPAGVVPSERAAEAKPDLAEARLRPTTAAHAGLAENVPVQGSWDSTPGLRSTAAEPGRFGSTPNGAALFQRQGAEPRPEPQRDRTSSESAERRHPRVGLFIGGALVAIGLVAGGTGLIMMRSARSVARLPIISADITPANAALADVSADNDERSKPASDRVDGADTADTTKLVGFDDKAAASPLSPGDDNNPISQVDAGKLVPGASPSAPPSAGAAADANSASGKTPTDSVVDKDKISSIPVDADLLAINRDRDNIGGDAAAGAAPAAPAVVPIPPARPVDKPVVVSSPGGTVGLHPKKAGEPLASPPTVASSGGAFVQLSAQKSENTAKSTYHDLQAKFSTIFGKLDPNIQRADLGDKGVYYRLRIGPFASAEARKICGSYQAAGGNCFIVRQ